jgi:putative phage-type endonuclease
MNAVVALPAAPTRSDWLAQRRTGIGGSDVAAILGLSKWRTPLDVYLDKRGERGDQPDNQAMAWGRRLESAVLSAYAEETRQDVRRPEGIIAHARFDWMLANLDGFTDEPRVVEVKTARTASGWGEPGTNEVPDDYALQVQHYMAVTGFDVADIAVLIGGSDFRIYTVPADPQLQADVIEQLAAFWQRVQDGDPPPPVSYADAVQRYGHSAAVGAVQADRAARDAYAALRVIRERMAALEAQEAEAKAALLNALGEAGDTLTDNGKTLATWKLAKAPERFDTARFKTEHPDLAAAYTKAGEPFRRLLIKDNA